jgi:hypothetical protein
MTRSCLIEVGGRTRNLDAMFEHALHSLDTILPPGEYTTHAIHVMLSDCPVPCTFLGFLRALEPPMFDTAVRRIVLEVVEELMVQASCEVCVVWYE